MESETIKTGKKFLVYMESQGFRRTSGCADGNTGSYSLEITESRKGERTKEHELPTISVDFSYEEQRKDEKKPKVRVIMKMKDCLETQVKTLQAMQKGVNLISIAHDWGRENGTIIGEEKDKEGIYISRYAIK